MQEETIQVRVKNILQRICGEKDYITVAEIARGLGVSSRTVLRELTAVEEWLAHRGCKLEKKAGVGIRVDGDVADRDTIMRLLGEQKEEKFYTPRERQAIISSELLQTREPIKTYTFTRRLNITESTVSNDLDKVEEWLGQQGISLVRKPGLGVYIEGQEDRIRKAMIRLIHEHINENELLALLRSNSSPVPLPINETELIARSRLLNLVNHGTIQQLEHLVARVEDEIGHPLADSAFVGLIVHLAIAVQRIAQNEDIVMESGLMGQLKLSREYPVAARLARELERVFDLKVPEDEIGYITMHIKGTKNRAGGSCDSATREFNPDLAHLANAVVRAAEAETGKFLSQNEKLVTGLIEHLGPALNRLRMNLEIRNPLYEAVKTHYPQLLQLTEKCVGELERELGMKIPGPEVAYIAMHLGAALEESGFGARRIFRAAIACATGIGTSRLLAAKIEKEFENIHNVAVVSALYLEENWLREQRVELVISTVGIDRCPVPVVVVNPLLLEEDKINIAKLLELVKPVAASQAAGKNRLLGLKDKMQELNGYGQAVSEILDHFFVREASETTNIAALIREVSAELETDPQARHNLEAALHSREAKGGTIMTGQELWLLHCRTDAVERLYFGVVKLRKGFVSSEGEPLELAVVIAAPEKCTKYLLETVSYVNGMLIENPEFLTLFKTGNGTEILEGLSGILDEFYQGKAHKYFLV